jgi:hypothetical protein
MVLELQVDGSFGRRENNRLDIVSPRNFVNLSNVLKKE